MKKFDRNSIFYCIVVLLILWKLLTKLEYPFEQKLREFNHIQGQMQNKRASEYMKEIQFLLQERGGQKICGEIESAFISHTEAEVISLLTKELHQTEISK